MKEKVQILIRLMKRNPDVPIGTLHDVVIYIFEQRHKVYKKQEVDPTYVSLN